MGGVWEDAAVETSPRVVEAGVSIRVALWSVAVKKSRTAIHGVASSWREVDPAGRRSRGAVIQRDVSARQEPHPTHLRKASLRYLASFTTQADRS